MNQIWNLILKLQNSTMLIKLQEKVENLLEIKDLILRVIDLKVN